MRVLVACEESQRVCKAFRDRGHEAYSCDMVRCSGNYPEWHIWSDVRIVLYGHWTFITEDGTLHHIDKWDLIIAHPPCTYLSNAGARWLYKGGTLNMNRYHEGLKAKEFFNMFYNLEGVKLCIENPIPSKVYKLPPYTQVIQPYEYGEPWSKKTCLWLKNLPKLHPTNILTEHIPFCSSGTYSKNHDKRYAGASRKGGASAARSKTFIGIAEAMAQQWG